MKEIISDVASDVEDLMEQFRDRLGIDATIELEEETGDEIIISFDRWINIAIYEGDYHDEVLDKTTERVCLDVNIVKHYPATRHEPEDFEYVLQRTYVLPMSAVSKVMSLYWENRISVAFECIYEDRTQIEEEKMYKEMDDDLSMRK